MLPFPRAHYYVLAFLVLTVIAFAPSYFLVLPNASAAHHVHGITATVWVLLLASQSWTIHHTRWRMHKWSGIASLALVPVFTIGGIWVTQVTLQSTSPFYELFGLALATVDFVSVGAFLLFYALALHYRRTPDLHARYMLLTIFPLFSPSIARLFANYMPGFTIRSPEELYKFCYAVDASIGVAIGICAILLYRDYKSRKPLTPFVLGTALILLIYAIYATFGRSAVWKEMADIFAAWPLWTVLALSGLAGAAAGWWGWANPAPRQSIRPPTAPVAKNEPVMRI